MSHHGTPTAQDIHDLLSQWEGKRGSKGGWWALAGVKYLDGTSDTERKVEIAKYLAAFLARYPNSSEEFVEDLSATRTDYRGLLLAGCVRSTLYGAVINCVVKDWLAAHCRRRGHGSVLSALKDHSVRWQELLERNNFSVEIIADFDKPRDSVSVRAETTVNMQHPTGFPEKIVEKIREGTRSELLHLNRICCSNGYADGS